MRKDLRFTIETRQVPEVLLDDGSARDVSVVQDLLNQLLRDPASAILVNDAALANWLVERGVVVRGTEEQLLATILVVLIAIGVTAFVATRRTEGEFQRYVEKRSSLDDRRMGYILARFYEQHGNWEGVQDEIENLANISGQQVVLADAGGQIIADSADRLTGKSVEARWPRPAVIVSQSGVPVGTAYLDPLKQPLDPATSFI